MRRGHHAQMQEAPMAALGHVEGGHRLFGNLHLVENAPRVAQHLFTGLAQADFLALLDQQLQAQIGFELLQLHGGGRLRDAHLLGAARVAQVAGHRLEQAQLAQGEVFKAGNP